MKIEITFVLPSLSAGGAERIMSFIAQNINPEKFNSTLLIAGYEKDSAYTVEGIKVVYLNSARVRYSIRAIYSYLKKNKPTIVVSSIAHLNTSIALISIFFPKIKFIGREANVLSVIKQFKKGNDWFQSFLLKISYRLFDAIICQSKDMMNDMLTNYGIPESKLILINNPITDEFEVKADIESQNESPRSFVTVASLKKQKGHLRILNVLANVQYPFTYTLIGDGPQKDIIFETVKTLGLTKKVTHIPFSSEVSKYLAKSDFFLQGAYVEGFPNCLLESSAVGTPIIAFKAPGGLDEIIQPDVNGYIADNEMEYLEYLNLEKKWDPKKISQSVYNKFSKEIIIKKYEDLFFKV
ncbi:glycosyltransferase [Allomuricauda sp. R78024]|uniref:glycosyltransferase n=1 Tax=Allomuricauda sp. R78024 TaxID=3093867 RepID=UPI0037CA9C2E